ncbi:MAG: RagB/SusD family nutrient uptake outer membrane protein [Mucilaginibacter sp.]|uniref:RagB/SusD family nutrient uptake outer membrane protein n=1 Tax=Mucilaginibacter sp. TaxID=1882438 RepID=UPI0032650664
MKILKYTLLTTLILTATACNKMLDTNPTDFITPAAYYKTPYQLQNALIGVYATMGNIGAFGNNYLYNFNTNSDESYGRATEDTPSFLFGAENVNVSNFWQQMYAGIGNANLLLASIDGVTATQSQKDVIRGETLFLRSYFYFMLVSNYGDVPLVIDPTGSITDVNIARAPMKQVYLQIINDLTSAETLLKTQTITSLGYSGKANHTAVMGLLARVNLYMAGFPLYDVSRYPEVISWCQKIIDTKEHALNPDYKQVFINYAQDKYDIKENLFEIEFEGLVSGKNLGTTYTGRYCGIRCVDETKGFSAGYLNATKKLYDAYELNTLNTASPNKTSFDIRRDWNCANYTWSETTTATYTPVTNTWIMNSGKWRREYETTATKDKNYTNENYAVIRYSDILLMMAEAENELNGPTKAYPFVNQVRQRGYGILYGNVVRNIAITNAGSGYTTAPTVNIVGGGGSGATATATVAAGKITSISIINPGTLTVAGPYYTSAPTITFTATAGTGAAATATISKSTDADLSATQTASKESLRQAIKDERLRELCFEAFRRNDLIRWGNYVGDIKDFLAYASANGGTATVITTPATRLSSRNIYFPIPIHEMSLNKALVQNPGY